MTDSTKLDSASWPLVPLRDLGMLLSGQSPVSSTVNDAGEGVPYVSGPEQWDGQTVHVDKWTVDARRIAPEGCLFITVKGSRAGTVFPGVEAAIGRDLMAFQPRAMIDVGYLTYALRHAFDLLKQEARGDIPGLSRDQLLNFVIPLPPLEAQRIVVETLDRQFTILEAGIASLKEAEAKAEIYPITVYQAAARGELQPMEVGGIEIDEAAANHGTLDSALILHHKGATLHDGTPTVNSGNDVWSELPAGWEWRQLIDVVELESGHTPSRSRPEYWDGDIRWVSIQDAREHNGGEIHTTRRSITREGLANSSARLLPRGTVCVSRTASVGYVVVLGDEMATSQDFAALVPSTALTPEWLKVLFLGEKSSLLGMSKGSVHQTVYMTEWKAMYLAVPPLNEQKRILSEVEHRLSIIKHQHAFLQDCLVRTETLRKSVYRQFFPALLLTGSENVRSKSDAPSRIFDRSRLIVISPKRSDEQDSKHEVKDIVDVLGKHPDGLTPDRLFYMTGYHLKGDIDGFYRALGSVMAKIVEERNIPDGPDTWPYFGSVTIKLRESGLA